MRLGSISRLILYPAAGVLLLLVMASHWLLFSEDGANFAVGLLVGRVDGLSLDYASGTVARGIAVTNLVYKTPELTVSAPQLRLRLNLPALLRLRIVIARVSTQSLDVQYQSNPAAESSTPTRVNITMPIRIAHARVDGADVQINQAAPIHVDSVETAVELGGATLALKHLRVVADNTRLDGAGTLSLNAPYVFDSSFRLVASSRFATVAMMMHGRAHGTQDRIEVQADLISPNEGRITAVVEPATEHFKVTADVAHLALERLTGQAASLSKSHVTAQGRFSKFRYDARARLASPWFADLDVDLRGTGDTAHIELDQGRVTSTDSALNMSGAFEFASNHLTAAIRGGLMGRQVEASANVTVPDLARMRANGRLNVDGNRLDFSSRTAGHVNFTLDADNPGALDPRLHGHLVGTGAVDVGSGRFKLDLSSDQLDVAGESFIDVRGELSNETQQGMAATLSVNRWERGKTVLGGGRLVYAGADLTQGDLTLDWQTPEASLHLESRLGVQGGQIKGAIRAGKIDVSGQDWSLASAADFSVTADAAHVAGQCWYHDEAKVCLTPINYAKDHLRLAVTASKLAFASFSSDGLNISADLQFGQPSSYRVETRGELALATPAVSLQQLDVSLEGDGSTFRFSGNTSLINPWVTDARLTLQGTLSASAVTFDALKLTAPDATLAVNGRYDVAPGHLAAEVKGHWFGQAVDGKTNVTGLPVSPNGSARIALAGNVATLDMAGAGKIAATIAAPDLSALGPNWQGAFDGKGQFDSANSSFTLEGTSPSLRYGSLRLDDVRLQGTGKDDNVNASTSIANVQYAGQPLGSGTVTLNGAFTKAAMAIALQLPDGSFDAHAILGYNKGALSGHMTDGKFTFSGAQWRLQAPFEFVMASGVAVIGHQCWQDSSGHVCVSQAHIASDQGRVDLDVVGLPLQLDKPWFAPDASVNGRVNASLSGSVDARSGKPVFQGNFRLGGARVKFGDEAGTSREMKLLVTAGIHDNVLIGDLSFTSTKGDLLAVNLQMPNVLKFNAFNARATLDTNDLGTVAAFIPQLENAKGSMKALISVDTLSVPMSADVSVKIPKGASVDIPLAGITLANLDLTVSGDARKVSVELSAASGKGQIKANGTVTNLFSVQRKVDLAVKGASFTALHRSDMDLVASPDLALTYDAADNISISGRFEVVDGNFKMPELGEEPRQPSSDVVIVSGEQASTPTGQLSLHLDVPVTRFNVDMYGLKSGVTGDVLLTQQGSSRRHLQGTLNLVGGTFSRFGQSFNIDKGRLIFSGPLDNPLVNVVTSRTITDTTGVNGPIKVSLTLSGPANDIQSTISSSPPMGGASALSYLVLGHPISSSTGMDSSKLSGAALALGLKQALPITQRIQSALGLSQLTLGTTDVDSTSVIVGKQFAPNLYVEYDYDVFSRIGGILFNYQLTSRLSLETHTGQANSMQLIYNF